MLKRLLPMVGLLLAALLVFGAASISHATVLPQSATPTPATEEEPSADMDAPDTEETDSAEIIAQLTTQVEALQAQLAALEASVQLNQVNNAVYQLDQVELHAAGRTSERRRRNRKWRQRPGERHCPPVVHRRLA